MRLHNKNLHLPAWMVGAVCVFLAACSSKQASTLTLIATDVIPTITSSPTQVNPTFTHLPSLTVKRSPTAFPSPSPTAAPSPTPKPSQTLTPSITPSPTLSIVEQTTQEAENARITAAVATVESEMAMFPDCLAPQDHSYSPDGKWVAIWCVNNMTGIYNRSDPSINWPLKYNEIYSIEETRINQFYYIIPWHWSVDGRYLYLSIYHCCMDGGCPAYISGEALVRLDLITGKVTQTIELDQEGHNFYFVFSPGDKYLAYVRTWSEDLILNLVDMVTGEDQHIPLAETYDRAGGVVWSQDFTRIVFSAQTGDDCINMTYYLVMLDLDNYDQTILLESDTDEYSPVEWTEDNQIIVYLGYEQGYGTYDLETGEIIPYLTPTPTIHP